MDTWIKKCAWCNSDVALLVLRFSVAIIFLGAGWGKAVEMQSTVGMFGSMGFAPFWAYLVTAVELLGGLLVLLGAWTRTAALLLAITMLVATVKVLPSGLMAAFAPIALLGSTAALALAGAGRYAMMKE